MGEFDSGTVVKNRTREKWRWRRKRYPLPVEKKKVSVRKETDAVSATRPKIVSKNPDHTAATPSESTASRGVESKPWVHSSTTVQIIWEVPVHERLVNIGIGPSANLTKQKRSAKPGISVCSLHHKVDEQPNNKPKKGHCSHKRRENRRRILWLLWKLYQN